MVKVERKQKRGFSVAIIGIGLVVVVTLYLAADLGGTEYNFHTSDLLAVTTLRGPLSARYTPEELKVDETCLALPAIHPSGSFFYDNQVQSAPSPDAITPSFNIGSYLGKKVTYHMGGDVAHYTLIKELLAGKEGGIVFDMGANQGFYTYYFAALGMEVYAFEISKQNFVALQQGSVFNSKEVADRVHLYPVGLGKTTGRFSMQGGQYEGFLKQGGNAQGEILGVTFDCFAYHSQLDLSNVAFVKLDVEGFETAVLQGSHNSLFREGIKNVGGMIMEVGPSRWARARIDFPVGSGEMTRLSTLFQQTYILIRKNGTGYAKTCPEALAAKVLSDKSPRDLEGAYLHKVSLHELEPLLREMATTNADCNFWYVN